MNNSCIFPRDVMLEILSRLPGRSLVRFRCVCKLWNSLFHDRHFVSQQMSHASKNPNTYFGYYCIDIAGEVPIYSFEVEGNEVVACNKFIVPVRRTRLNYPYCMSNPCNGLIAVSVGSYGYVANPCTREWMALPEVSSNIPLHRRDSLRPDLGLGLCTTTGKYKVIRYFNPGNAVNRVCEVLTVGTDRSWRPLGKLPYSVTEFVPAYANGCIYWIIGASRGNKLIYRGPVGVLSFNVSEEKFMMIKLPQCDPEPYGVYRHFFVHVLEGCVCLIDWRMHLAEDRSCYLPVMHIHVLNNPQESTWTKSRTIRLRSVKLLMKGWMNRGPAANQMHPLQIKNGKLLLSRQYQSWRLHDLRTGACTTIRLPPLKDIHNNVYPFVCADSIVPLDRLPLS